MSEARKKTYADLMGEIFFPGACLNSYGMRKSGKSFTAIAFAQSIIEGRFPGMPKTILMTNIPFVRKLRGGGMEMAYPEGVYHVTTLKDVFVTVADFIEKEGKKDTMAILLLDEGQNFLQGKMDSYPLTRAMKSLCGVLRKFNICLWFLTPVYANLGPAFRQFLNDPADPGNVTARFHKDDKKARAYAEHHHLSYSPRDIVWIQTSPEEKEIPVRIPHTSWLVMPDEAKVGQIFYDDGGSGGFELGEGFDYEGLIRYVSEGSSYEYVSRIRRFLFEESGNPDNPTASERQQELYEKWARQYQAEVCVRLKQKGVKLRDIAYGLGISERTVTNRVNAYESNFAEVRKKKEASGPGKQQNASDSATDIYISLTPSDNKGIAEIPLPSPSPGKPPARGVDGSPSPHTPTCKTGRRV